MEPQVSIHEFVHNESQAALTDLLRLPDFQVTGYELDEYAQKVIFFGEVVHDYGVCPRCQGVSDEIHEHHLRIKRDLSAFGLDSYLEYAHRRFKCGHCRKPFTEVLSSVEERSRYTLRYEQYIFDHYRESSIQHISRQERLGYKAAQGIFYRQAAAQLCAQARPLVKRLGVDEISTKKRHKQFALVISDLDRRCTIAVIEERHKEKLEAWFDQLSDEERAAIEEVSMDMWSPYKAAVEAKLPDADIVADRFHLMQNLNRAVTKARRDIQRGADPEIKAQLKGSRWLLVKNQGNLSDDEKERLEQLFRHAPQLEILHQLKEAFRDIFEAEHMRADAIEALADWVDTVQQAGLDKLDTFLNTLENWAVEVSNYFNQRTTQGFVEGMNQKIKLIMRRGYGYRNFSNFTLRILAECGLRT